MRFGVSFVLCNILQEFNLKGCVDEIFELIDKMLLSGPFPLKSCMLFRLQICRNLRSAELATRVRTCTRTQLQNQLD